MGRPTLTVGDVFRRYGDAYRAAAGPAVSPSQQRVMTAIEQCRTAALGGHVEQCDRCGHTRIWYNSCANRHCPTCQSLARAAWIDARHAELLDCEYFHVVFTVPDPIAVIAFHNKAVVYGLLFRAAAETLRTIAADPRHLGATIGFFAVLHTWGSTLVHHPHLHCVVPGGGPLARRHALDRVSARVLPARARALAPLPPTLADVSASRRLTRARFDSGLRSRRWRIRRPSPGTSRRRGERSGSCTPNRPSPARSRSSTTSAGIRIASPSRMSACSISRDDHVRFRYKHYRADAAPQTKTMTLPAPEFIRRFLLHVLPPGFHRIRYYGFLGNRVRREQLARCRRLLHMPPRRPPDEPASIDYRDQCEALIGASLRACPVCAEGHMRVIEHVVRLRPPFTDTS